MTGGPQRHASPAAVAALLFGSGWCALVYQVAWQREFRLIFGMSTAASAAVLAVFMGGLGAGGLLLGRRADSHPRPLRLYAQLELAVALLAAATPFFVLLVRRLYEMSGGSAELGLGLATVLRLVLATAVLLPATLCAGGTLPAACSAVQRTQDERRRGTALLYGVNTMGALAGCITANFWMLEAFGTRTTLWLGSALNVLVAMAALLYARRLAPTDDRIVPEPEAGDAGPPAWRPRLVLAAAGLSGFVFFLMEIVWYRMLGPILGGTVYTFGLILAVALAGIGVGGLAYSVAAPRRPTFVTLSITFMAQAACLLVPYAMGDRLAILAIVNRPVPGSTLSSYVVGWVLVCGIVVLPGALAAGVQFSLLLALMGRGRTGVGRDVGAVYALNTVGAIAGALAGGFGLLPLLTAQGCWRASVVLLVIAATAAVLAAEQKSRPALVAIAVFAGVVAGVLLTVHGPTSAWRHSGVGAGRALLGGSSANAQERWLRANRRTLVWEEEGVESSVALSSSTGYALMVNGKSDGHARNDASTTIMSGLIGPLIKPTPVRKGLVIGLGTGATTGWLAALPEVERLDVVELEPAVLRVARDCAPVNQDVMTNPRVRVLTGDAREVLMTSRDTYDLISSEPSNPYRAGVSSLFTREFYAASRSRLAPDGVLVQWLQAYEVQEQTILQVLATVATEFDNVDVWLAHRSDLVLVASNGPRTIDAAELARRVGTEPYASALRHTWRVGTAEGVLAHFIAGPELGRRLVAAGTPPNTDDRNTIEFGFARSLAHSRPSVIPDLRRRAAAVGAARPSVAGMVDWAAVADARLASATWSNTWADPVEPGNPTRLRAYNLYIEGDPRAAATLLRSVGPAGDDVAERAILAEGLAEAGDFAAEAAISSLRPAQPIEADVMLARLRLRQGRPAEAVAPMAAAYTAYRRDPWPQPAVMTRALTLAVELAQAHPPAAPALYDALAEPFVVGMLDDLRLRVRTQLATTPSLKPRCADAFAAWGPWHPWELTMLAQRVECARATGDARLVDASRDVDAYLEAEPNPR